MFSLEGYISVRVAGYPLSLQFREYGHRSRVMLIVLAFKNMNVLNVMLFSPSLSH